MESLFFYDLETTGVSSTKDRILQFSGIRVDYDFNQIGEPVDIIVCIPPDVLPNPDAILITGLSPFITQSEGIKDYEIAKIFNQEISKPGTTFVGYNNVRFDDEFIRNLNYRNFYDAYSWHWKDGSSRWDLLDLVRMTRALRPDGIKWPLTEEGKPTNRLELMTKSNGLDHESAHNALSDVIATIELAKLIRQKQPKLFDYLLSIKSKDAVAKLINNETPFVYTTSHYSSDYLHTSIAISLDIDIKKSSALVYDLRFNPKEFIDLSIDELVERWKYDPERKDTRLPVKTVKLNRCPAVAPLAVLDNDSEKRIKIDKQKAMEYAEVIKANKVDFVDKLNQVIIKLNKVREEERTTYAKRIPLADEKLYDSFIEKVDQQLFEEARDKATLPKPGIKFSETRLNDLYKLYRYRNFEESLTPLEREEYRNIMIAKLFNGEESIYSKYVARIKDLKLEHKNDSSKIELLTELEEYAESILDEYEIDLQAMESLQ